jgi:hypothetical protein
MSFLEKKPFFLQEKTFFISQLLRQSFFVMLKLIIIMSSLAQSGNLKLHLFQVKIHRESLQLLQRHWIP